MKFSIDFETRSAVDLRKCGAYVYAESPTTDILCMGYAFEDEPVKMWKYGEAFPVELMKFPIYAWNANFEYLIWNEVGVKKYGWPKLPLEQTYCTMAMALAMSLPGKLENVSPALGIKAQKDMQGNRVMLQLSKPRQVKDDGTIVWWTPEEFPEKYERLYEYCKQDVEVEREAAKKLLPLSPSERKIWLIDQKINGRGVKIDLPSVRSAMNVIESEKKRLDAEMRKVTGLSVASSSAVGQLTTWLASKGVETESVGKGDVVELLKKELHRDVRRALEIRKEAGKSSTAKLNAMVLRSCSDGRVRGTQQYHGAGTGRFAGRGLQTQNFPRPNLKHDEIEGVIAILNGSANPAEIDMFYGAPTSVISDCLRSFIRAEDGKNLLAVDFAAIEARVLAWLANEIKKLNVFRTHGKIYEAAAADIYNVALELVNKEQRQIGKVADLALGFQGGKGAFQSMAKLYGVNVSDERAESIKVAWRKANPAIVKFWYDLDNAAISAVLKPGQIFAAGPEGREIKYKVSGTFLFCRLPSGRAIVYPYPQIERDSKFGRDIVTYMAEDSYTKKWTRQKGYGGLWAENVTQGVARCVLTDALIRLEDKGYETVMTVHDELVCEGNQDLKEMEELMCQVPVWAEGLPIAAEGWKEKRYRK